MIGKIEAEVAAGGAKVWEGTNRSWGHWLNVDLTRRGLAEKGYHIEILPGACLQVFRTNMQLKTQEDKNGRINTAAATSIPGSQQ